MVFAETYDFERPLEEQIDEPIVADGLELVLTKVGTKHERINGFLAIKGENETTYMLLTKKESIHMAILMMDGYVTSEELSKAIYGSADYVDSIRTLMSQIRKKIEDDKQEIIKTKQKPGRSGYYVGNITDHRKDHEISYSGFVLNTKTGYVVLPNGALVDLGNVETDIMEILIRSEGSSSAVHLLGQIYKISGASPDEETRRASDSLRARIYAMNVKMKEAGGRNPIAGNQKGTYLLSA